MVDNGEAAYTYDGDGQRVTKSLWGGSSGTIYWYGTHGEVLAESDLSGNITAEYVYFNGKRLARTDNPTNAETSALRYYISDHLGSTDMVMDETFSNVLEDTDYYPYGGIAYQSGSGDLNHFLFTGKERDSETGNDYFGARYYSNNLGRFMTPDWSAKRVTVPYAHFGNPQSLNLYSYVQNNPTTLGDPDGHQDPASPFAEQLMREMTFSVIGGLGAGGEIQTPAGSFKADVSITLNLQFNAGELTLSKDTNLGVTVGSQDGTKVGLAAGESRRLGSWNMDTGQTRGMGPAVADNTVGVSRGNGNANAGDGKVTAGNAIGNGLMIGGSASITKTGINMVTQAVSAAASSVASTVRGFFVGPPPSPGLPGAPSTPSGSSGTPGSNSGTSNKSTDNSRDSAINFSFNKNNGLIGGSKEFW